MGRNSVRHDMLSPTIISGIRKLYNGSVNIFHQKYLDPVINQQLFYTAMRMDHIAFETSDYIEQAFHQACLNNFINPDELDLLPTFPELISQLTKALETAHENPQVFDIDLFTKQFYIPIKFYNVKLEDGSISFDKGRKSCLL